MDTQSLLKQAQELLSPISTDTNFPEENRMDIFLTPSALIPAVEKLHTTHWGYLSAITGLDHIPSSQGTSEEREWAHTAEGEEQTGFGYSGSIEVLYHFCYRAAILTLRVQLPYQHTVVPSLCHLIPSATLFERELMEMFGVVVENTPNTDHLLLPDDWPAGVYPLRKEFTGFDSYDEGTGDTDDAA